MNVLHVVHWPRSGIGVVIRDLVRHRSPDIEHRVFCLAEGKPTTDDIRLAGATVDEPSGRPRGWMSSLSGLYSGRGWADLIHSHSLTPRVLAAIGRGPLPHLSTVHAAYLYFESPRPRAAVKRWMERVAARRTDEPLICVSQDVAASLPGRSMRSDATVIPNGIDIEAVRGNARLQHGNLKGAPLLVAIGRLDWEKGFDKLLQAIAPLRCRFPGIRLVICGDGVERDSLEAMARDLDLSDTVEFTGHIPNPMPIVQAADIFVSSSVQEGFALTVAEAMALGKPIVATPVAGVASRLTHMEDVIMATGFSSEDISDALLEALSSPEQLARIGENGRRFAEENLDVRRAVAQYEELYRRMFRGLA